MLSKKNTIYFAVFSIVLSILIISLIGTAFAGMTAGQGANLDLDINPDGPTSNPNPHANDIPPTTDPTTDPTTPPVDQTPTTTPTTTSGGSTGGGGGGGGGGGSSLAVCIPTDWNCTKWTDCKNSTQTRVCKLTKTNCQVQNQTKPQETLKCITGPNSSELTNSSLTNSSSSELTPKNSITGAAIGAKIADNWVIIVSIIFIAIIILTYFFLYKLRR